MQSSAIYSGAAVAANPYQVVRDETATPIDLWDRGYKRCVALLSGAKRAIEQREHAQQGRMLFDAFAIVEFWTAALPIQEEAHDASTPGLAPRLRIAYEFILNKIAHGNAFGKTEDLDEAIHMLAHLHSIFHAKR
ncbi:flagellar protein FliS [Acidithiobacillus ferriphilus]|uniref:flagellar protein FliS n=1 Tax=Acidithiobacillus ferriphilus TaxID=1689834 RepID=UPI001C07E1FA|nr:flagellar protein FliS [Acidithiobacillus ferriphilus]MBU2829284.1 flagellar protein FliS [Acidithiobacillus ferriphilus]MBU2844713.1 flagellar protein FliS [Acidithiobacillus ferriphilus]MBU2847901.1 flagellar protein FliS [Acidithiobacillus ferriphilus]MEB8535874.1 flagellar protein FliS [Acidithiobacillus ferriphilus]